MDFERFFWGWEEGWDNIVFVRDSRKIREIGAGFGRFFRV